MEMRGRARMCAYSRRTRCAEETETSDRTSAREILERGERCSLLSFIVAAGPRARAAPLSRRGAPPCDEVMCVDRPIRHVADAFLIDAVIDREIDRTPRAFSAPGPSCSVHAVGCYITSSAVAMRLGCARRVWVTRALNMDDTQVQIELSLGPHALLALARHLW